MEWSARHDSTFPWSMADGLKWTVLVVRFKCRVISSETWVNCLDPNHQVIMAGGRDPEETQETSAWRPTDRGLLGVVIRAVNGRTECMRGKDKREKNQDESTWNGCSRCEKQTSWQDWESKESHHWNKKKRREESMDVFLCDFHFKDQRKGTKDESQEMANEKSKPFTGYHPAMKLLKGKKGVREGKNEEKKEDARKRQEEETEKILWRQKEKCSANAWMVPIFPDWKSSSFCLLSLMPFLLFSASSLLKDSFLGRNRVRRTLPSWLQ